MIGRAVLAMVLAAGITTPAAATQPVVTVTSPAWTTTVTDETLARWTASRRGEALTLLIASAWTAGEAVDRGVTVSGRAIREQAEPDPDLTRADELLLARTDLLSARIRDQITQPAAQSVTPEQIEAYVQANPRTDPERRRARVLETRSRAQAKRALKALRRGLTWSSAARRYGPGGTLRTVDEGTELSRHEQALFRAQKGELARYGTHVFKVTRVTPARPASLKVQRAQAWEILSSEAQLRALDAFQVELRAKWLPRTVCAPVIAAHPDCGNPPSGE